MNIINITELCTQVVKMEKKKKRNEILTQATTWTNTEDIKLIEISQSRQDKYCVILLGPRVIKFIEISRMAGAGEGSRGNYCVMGTEFLSGVIRTSGDG